jgi:UDP-glucose 4-epimerase
MESYASMLEGVDCVYHCACLAYEGLSVFSPHLVSINIVTATTGVLSAAIKNGVKRFVFCSSMARYGENEVPFKESFTPMPIDPYGIAKYSAEMLVQNLCKIHGMEYNIAVPHNIIGPRQNFTDPYRNVASIFINRMLKGQQPIIYGDGKQKRCFSYINDCLSCLIKLGFEDKIKNEIFNIGPDEEFITIIELAEMIADLLKFPLNPIYLQERPQEVKYANCSSDKARAVLGYKTEYTVKQGLAEMITYIRDIGPKDFRYNYVLEIVTDKTPKTWLERLI